MESDDKQLLILLSKELEKQKDRIKALENRCKLLEKDAEDKELETFG